MIEIDRKLREYDLKSLKDKEIDELHRNVRGIKEDWADLRVFL